MIVRDILSEKRCDVVTIEPSADLAGRRSCRPRSASAPPSCSMAVATCSENETIDGLMRRMTTGKFRHMPVVAKGALIGLISIGDVVKHRAQEIERESEELRSRIKDLEELVQLSRISLG